LAHFKNNKTPHDCKDIVEVRTEIDSIDYEIMKLFGLRFQYVKQVVKYKENTPKSIIAAERKKVVIEKRREWAIENGLNPDVFEKIYRVLINHFIDEEMKLAK
jgi:isochorismate pyruvate lyase